MGLLDFFANDETPRERPRPGPLELLATEPPAEADPPAAAAVQFHPEQVCWCLNNLPVRAASQNFLVCGCPGSGKTVTIRLFLQSIVPRLALGRGEQIIVFDAKRDMLGLLRGMGNPKPLWILNPFHVDSVSWDIARDLRSRANARYFARLLVPEEKQSSAPFFSEAAQQTVLAVLIALMHRGHWTLRDLLNALRTKERIEAITKACPGAAELAYPLTSDDKHFPSVLASIATKVAKFEEVAALWHSNRNARRFTVGEFMQGGGVLLLGNDPVFNESLWPINALLFKVLTDHILKGPERPRPRHWFILDEFRWMGRVEAIAQLLNQGRSKGASVVLGIQDVEGLKAAYGEHGAEEILGQCATKTFFRAGSAGSAAWAERYFGQIRKWEQSHSQSTTSGHHDYSITRGSSTQMQDRSLFLASVFSDMPMPRSGLFAAVQDVPVLQPRTRLTRASFPALLSLLSPEIESAGNEERDPQEQEFTSWSPEEQQAFGARTKPPLPRRRRPSDEDDDLEHSRR